jgi:transposase
MPAGRPTKYEPQMCEQLIKCGKQGFSVVEMACHIGIHKDTLYDWAKNNPEFSDSLKIAMQHSQDWWEKKGRAATFGEIEGFNPTAYIFQMKNRFREDYSDVNKHEVKTDNPLVIVTTQQPDGGKD